jgi:hypothetical protein
MCLDVGSPSSRVYPARLYHRAGGGRTYGRAVNAALPRRPDLIGARRYEVVNAQVNATDYPLSLADAAD